VLAFIALWEFAVRSLDVSRVLFPAPSDVWGSLVHLVGLPGFFSEHVSLTLREILLGYACGAALGTTLGIVITRSRLMETVLEPFILASQMVPKLALAPLLVVWFGFGTTPRLIVVALITFFPLLINTILGIRSADADQHDLFRSIQASRRETFFKLELPGALPAIFGGLKVSIVFAVVGATVAEFIGGSQGLGAMIIASMGTYNVSQMFAILAVITVLGMLLYALLLAVERRFIGWHESVWSRASTM
jgi:NitT/TauT family transport system permease protein